MKKTFPSFELGIDHLFLSELKERKQKKEEQQRFASMLVSYMTLSRYLMRRQQSMRQNTQ